MKPFIALLLFTSLFAGGCASGSKSFRSGPLFKNGTEHLKPYKEIVLSNGLRVLMVEDTSLPSFYLGLMVKTGAASDVEGKTGVTAITAQLLSKETNQKNALVLSEAFGQLGTALEVSVDQDFTFFSAGTLSKNENALIDLFSEVILTPKFSEKELKRLKDQTISALDGRVDDPNAFSDELFDQYVYGQHPYSRITIGTKRDVLSLKPKDIVKHYVRYYHPGNSILTVVGRIPENISAKLEEKFGPWKPAEVTAIQYPKIDEIKSRQIRYISKPGMNQAQIRVGHVGIQRANPDFLKLRIAMTILGNGFASRLVDRVRDNLGLTYHISSSMEGRLQPGLFEISTFSQNANAGRAISETMSVLRDFVDKGVTESEVESAKNYLIGRFPQSIETGERLAFNLLILRLYGIPDTYLTQYRSSIQRISTTEVNRAIKTYLHPEQVKIVVFSNGDDVLNQLRLIGPVEVRSYSEFQ